MEISPERDGTVPILQMKNTEGHAATISRIVLHAAFSRRAWEVGRRADGFKGGRGVVTSLGPAWQWGHMG